MNWHQALELLEMLKKDNLVRPINLIGSKCPPEHAGVALQKLENVGLCKKVKCWKYIFLKAEVTPPLWVQTEELKNMGARDVIGLACLLSGETPQHYAKPLSRPVPSIQGIQRKVVGS